MNVTFAFQQFIKRNILFMKHIFKLKIALTAIVLFFSFSGFAQKLK